jgi:4-hydroxy-3-polyprenylbenzoate decarboxylase
VTNLQGGDDAGRVEALKSLRATLDWLGDDVHNIENEVDPLIEMTAITKAFDGSKALVANNIKDYPNTRMYSNLYATQERTAKLFDVSAYKDIKHKILDAYRNPLPANYVESADAPVHETVILASDIDQVTDILPIVLHTNEDGGRIFGSGCHLIGSPWVPDGGNTISMYRMAFRDNQKYASINMVPGGQGDVVCKRHPGEKIPITVNCSPPVGAELMAVGTLNPVIFPGQTDKIGMAGALQGSAIDLVKAKTVDAYAIAQSEWVLEGYVIEDERVWETDQAEQLGRQGEAPLHPEWARFMGRAYRTPRAFELTAITHRSKNPLYYTPHFGAIWYTIPFVCASIYEMCERMAPGSPPGAGSLFR